MQLILPFRLQAGGKGKAAGLSPNPRPASLPNCGNTATVIGDSDRHPQPIIYAVSSAAVDWRPAFLGFAHDLPFAAGGDKTLPIISSQASALRNEEHLRS
jgi:hypothetical protein